MSMLDKVLQDIGLNAAEAQVYLACLKLGTQDLKTVAKETGLSRVDTLSILSSLIERGFISRFAKAKEFFTPEHPEVVLELLKNDKHKMERGLKTFAKMLPEFLEFTRPGFTKPEITFYDGKYGVMAAYEDTLTSKSDILAIASIDDTESFLPDYTMKYYKRRKAAGIRMRALFPDTPKAAERRKKDKSELRTSHILPRSLMDFRIELNIYDDKVAYFSLQERLAVIVRSSIIADSMRNLFELCWRMAEMYQQSITPEPPSSKKRP